MEYIKGFKLEEENDSYNLILYLDIGLTEFAEEFGDSKKESSKSLDAFITDFIKTNFPDIKINSIKLMVGTVIVATINLHNIVGFAEALPLKSKPVFNMTYAYFETGNKMMEVLNQTKGILDVVSPTYFDLTNDGHLKITSQFDPYTIKQMQNKNYRVVPFLSNHWDRDIGRLALQNREVLVKEIVDVIYQYNLDGINVDIENVTLEDRDNYTLFVKALRESLPKEKEVSVAVAANPHGYTKGWYASYDYEKLAQYSDYLFIMAYDEHYETGNPGPVASLEFVEDSIKYALKYVPPSKIVLGLPFFGRYWKDDNSIKGKGTNLILINNLIRKYQGTISFDNNLKSPKATIDITGYEPGFPMGKYTIWFENEESILYKLNLIDKYNLKGAGSWSLHQGTQNIWNVYNQWINSSRIYLDIEKQWAKAPILSISDRGIMIGTRDFYFEPEKPLTRAETATIIVRALGLKGNNKSTYFKDLPNNHWAKNDIEIVVQNGFMEGKGNNKFAPDKPITREEMAVLLSRVLNISTQNNLKNPYKDVKTGSWSYPYIISTTQEKIFEGFEDGTFRPKDNITRAQMAALLERIKL